MTAAKAVAAIVTPLVLVVLAKLAAACGVDVTFDEDTVNQAIVAIVTAASVYLVPNKPSY